MSNEPQRAFWLCGGEPMCWDCVEKEAESDDEILGGYRLETDTLPYCPGCNVELDLLPLFDYRSAQRLQDMQWHVENRGE